MSFVLSLLSAAVCCTDLTSVVPLIELNKTINQHLITGSFSAASLKWYESYFYNFPKV